MDLILLFTAERLYDGDLQLAGGESITATRVEVGITKEIEYLSKIGISNGTHHSFKLSPKSSFKNNFFKKMFSKSQKLFEYKHEKARAKKIAKCFARTAAPVANHINILKL